jgi:hypothetical protein
VRVLLDEDLPRRLTRYLPDHYVPTVQQEGWAGLRNGDLLRHASVGGFDVLLTADQNLQFQQNLAETNLGVIVLVAQSNKLDDLLPLVPAVLSMVEDLRPGEIRRVGSS